MFGKAAQPNFSECQVIDLVKRLFHLTVVKAHPLPSYDDQNFYVSAGDGAEYVLKIMNSEDSKNTDLIEVQTYAMSFLQQNGVPAQTAVLNLKGQLLSLEEMDCGYGPQRYLVRLLTYLPGVMLSTVAVSSQILFEVGKTVAEMDQIFQKMEHPHLGTLQREQFRWSLSSVPLLESYLSLLDGEPLQDVAKSVIHQYKTTVAPKYSQFRKCINHGDFNELNILVKPDETSGFRISGVLDFGDMSSGYFVHELAIAIMYMCTQHPNPVEAGGPVLAGFSSVFPLNEAEKDSLYILVLSRFCQSLILARHGISLHPENAEYLMITHRKGVGILSQLWELGKEHVEEVWFQSAARLASQPVESKM
ncbi:hydroxylysine kinase-like isoform 1-T1 [Synchiropus picturatus]